MKRHTTLMPIAASLLFMLTALISIRTTSLADEANPIVQNSPAPELVGSDWLNTSGKTPIKLASRAGKVTIVHFWTYGCINCRRNLPAYAKWQKQYAGTDVAILGVHTPETPGEAKAAKVRSHVADYGITYPVLVDSNHANWDRWHQRFWPTIYLIDKHGRIRYRWEGELEYDNQNGTRKVTELVEKLRKES